MKKTIILFLLFPVLMSAQTILWDGTEGTMSIGNSVRILEDASGLFSYEQVASASFNNKFKSSQQKILSLGYTDSFFWLKFSISNTSYNNVILELSQAGLPDVDLYYRVNGGSTRHIKSGYNSNIHEKAFNSSYMVFSLPQGDIECFVRLNTNSEPVPIRLYSESSFAISATKQKLSYGIYLGLMFFVILNSCFLYFSLRKRLYLFYALVVILYILYSAAVIDGFLIYLVPGADLKFLYTTIPAIGIPLQTIYCLIFLEVKKYRPKLYKSISGFIIYFLVWMIVKFFLPFSIVQPVNTIHALLSFFIMGYVGIKVGKRGNKMGYYFAYAYFMYFLLVMIQAIYINTGIPSYLGGISHVAMATLIEAFLLSFLLTRRFEWEKEEIEQEKFEAQISLLEKNKENRRIIQQQNQKLEKEVVSRTAELQQTNQQLTTTNNRLVDLNREKDGLVNIVAHDLKSPLANIISFVEVMKNDDLPRNTLNEYLTVIEKVTQNGFHLIEDLLDVHYFEYGSPNLKPEPIDIKRFMPEWVKTFDHELKRKNQSIDLKIEVVDNASFYCDQLILSRILNNLLSNAIKFSDNGTNIMVNVKESYASMSFSVKDEGPGISLEDQKMMFKRFQKLSARPTNGESSNGLGLSIIKVLVDKLRGEINVESQIGKGTEFIINLPKK